MQHQTHHAGSRLQAPDVAALAVMMVDAAAALADSFPIAGVDPSRRPKGTPVVTEFPKVAAWYQQALPGISKPYPASLRFLEDQGALHMPFNRPGMSPAYDIRRWHDRASEGPRRSREYRHNDSGAPVPLAHAAPALDETSDWQARELRGAEA